MDSGREQNYWPGFVDALSNVVLTLVFVLVIFVFALLMASQKVKAKMTEVKEAEKAQQASQTQLNQALAELEQMKSQETDPKNPQSSCLRFSKSDATQTTEADAEGLSLLILFSVNAISVTDDTNKTIHDFIDAYRTKSGNKDAKFTIQASDDPTAVSPLMAKETQLGRMLNVRNSLLANQVSPGGIAIHNIPPVQQKDSYNWVKINVEK
jgi:hypothetical protein